MLFLFCPPAALMIKLNALPLSCGALRRGASRSAKRLCLRAFVPSTGFCSLRGSPPALASCAQRAEAEVDGSVLLGETWAHGVPSCAFCG